jgi:hypothetical protein
MSPFVLSLTKLNGPVWETQLSDLVTIVSWSRLLYWSLPSPLEPCLALLPPLLDSFLYLALLHHRSKTCSLTLSSPDCSLADQHGTILRCFSLVPMTRNCYYLWGNRMVRFGIPNYQVYLPSGSPILLVADIPVTAASCVVASMAKTLSRS